MPNFLFHDQSMLGYIAMPICRGMRWTEFKNITISVMVDTAFPSWMNSASNSLKMVVTNKPHWLALADTATSKCSGSYRRGQAAAAFTGFNHGADYTMFRVAF